MRHGRQQGHVGERTPIAAALNGKLGHHAAFFAQREELAHIRGRLRLGEVQVDDFVVDDDADPGGVFKGKTGKSHQQILRAGKVGRW